MESKKILVIDDEEEILSLLDDFLSPKGYHVSTASTPQAGLEAAKNEVYPVLIVDRQLPEMDGVEVARRIREGNKNISVILITGNPTVDSTLDLIGMGNTDFLIKPIDLDYLETLVEKALKTYYVLENYDKKPILLLARQV